MKRNQISIFLLLKSSVFVFFLSSYFVVAEANAGDNPKENTKQEKKQEFELFLKRQAYDFTPFNYTSYSEKTNTTDSAETNHLQQNRKVLVPAVFSYENYEKNYRVEMSYYEIELVNPNSNVYRANPQGVSVERFYYSPVARSEFEINGYKIISLTKDWNILLGGGIRNINKYTYGNYLRDGAFQEYFYTYGPQFSLQSTYSILDRLSAKVSFDTFYTEGTRFLQNPVFTPSSILVTNGSAGTKGMFRGYETELSFQYRFYENMKFHIGYNQISSYFSYLHYDQVNFRLDPSQTNQWSISNGSKNGNYEILKGFFLGFSVFF